MQGEIGCFACGQKQYRWLGEKHHYDLRQCSQCGTIFTRGQIEGAALTELYDHYYDAAHFALPAVAIRSLERVIMSFAPFRVTGRILDIGYGEGGLLQIAEKQGWQCYGTEISPQALAYGEHAGWCVTNDAENDPRFEPQSFDVVTMIELLEHIPNPQRMLQAAAHWVRPGGLLYLTTPNAQSLNQRVLGTAWSVVSPPEHIVLWSAKGLRYALPKFGFQRIQIRAEGLNPFEILARFRSQPKSVNRNQTGTELNQTFSSSPIRRVLKTGVNHFLSALQLGDRLKVYATRDA